MGYGPLPGCSNGWLVCICVHVHSPPTRTSACAPVCICAWVQMGLLEPDGCIQLICTCVNGASSAGQVCAANCACANRATSATPVHVAPFACVRMHQFVSCSPFLRAASLERLKTSDLEVTTKVMWRKKNWNYLLNICIKFKVTFVLTQLLKEILDTSPGLLLF